MSIVNARHAWNYALTDPVLRSWVLEIRDHLETCPMVVNLCTYDAEQWKGQTPEEQAIEKLKEMKNGKRYKAASPTIRPVIPFSDDFIKVKGILLVLTEEQKEIVRETDLQELRTNAVHKCWLCPVIISPEQQISVLSRHSEGTSSRDVPSNEQGTTLSSSIKKTSRKDRFRKSIQLRRSRDSIFSRHDQNPLTHNRVIKNPFVIETINGKETLCLSNRTMGMSIDFGSERSFGVSRPCGRNLQNLTDGKVVVQKKFPQLGKENGKEYTTYLPLKEFLDFTKDEKSGQLLRFYFDH